MMSRLPVFMTSLLIAILFIKYVFYSTISGIFGDTLITGGLIAFIFLAIFAGVYLFIMGDLG